MAIIHITIFDAVNTIVGGYHNYLPYPRPNGPVSIPAAVAQGARDALVALYPSQTPSFDTWLAEDLDAIPDGTAKTNGVAVGKGVCVNILTARDARRLGDSRPDSRDRVVHERSTGPLATRPDQLNPESSGRLLEQSVAVCDEIERAIPRPGSS